MSRRFHCLAGLLFAGLPLSSQAWVSVANKGLALASGTVTTPASASEPVHIAVSLQLRDEAGLHSFINSVSTPGNPAYGHFLATGEFANLYGATAADAQSVADYLAASGFSGISINPARTLITATGTAGVLQKAFNTQLVDLTWQGKPRYANVSDVQVPDSLQGLVVSVAGATNIEVMHLHNQGAKAFQEASRLKRNAAAKAKASTSPDGGTAAAHPDGYTGPQFQIAYDATGISTAHLTTVAIVTEGDDLSTVISDLREAEVLNKQPIVPVEVIPINPITTIDTSGDGEWDLDSQSSTGIADNVKDLLFYNTASLGDSDIVPAVQKFADDNRAQVGNMSFGGCELEAVEPVGDIDGYEAAFMQAVAQGQTWFASTGDTGSACGSPENTGAPTGVPNAEYPSSSPNVVAAGGTTLSTDADYNYVSEASWIGGGGGVSYIFAAPQWQIASGAVPTASIPATGVANGDGVPASESGSGRGTPDVAMSADPSSGLATIAGGARETIGGTSLSSPLSMGSYARLQSANCNKLGFAAPLYYSLDKTTGVMSTANGFNDVTSGENGTYVATTGWDYNTGFGSPDITKVNAAIAGPGCASDQNPVAKLSADTQSGNFPLTVNFNGTGASDPDNDGIAWYTLDFGDGSTAIIQNNPTFPAHSYAIPGQYTATSTVRDGVGNVSLPVSLPITVTGTPPGCTLPGQLLITSPAGVVGIESMGEDTESGTDDILSVSFAEPATLTDQLVFTFKVANLSTLYPLNYWIVAFNVSGDDNDYYVAMKTDSTGTVSYEYGLVGSETVAVQGFYTYIMSGALDASSNYNADGTITLVLNKSSLNIKTGDTLTGLQAKTRIAESGDPTGTVPSGVGESPDIASSNGFYTIAGNDVCKADLSGGGSSSGSTGSGSSSSGSGSSSSSSGGGSSSGSTPVGGSSAQGGASALDWITLMFLGSALGFRRRR